MNQWKDSYKLIKDSLWTIKKLNSWKLTFVCIIEIIRTLITLITIYLSAEIINLFLGGRGKEQLWLTASACLIMIFALTIIKSIFEKKDNLSTERCHKEYKLYKSRTNMDMDYVRLESAEIKELKAGLHMKESYGLGLSTLLQCINTLIADLALAGFAVMFLIFNIGRTGIRSAGVMLIYFAFIIILSLLASYNIKKANDISMKAIMESVPKRIITSDFLLYEGGISHKDGKDIRMSGLDKVIRNYCDLAVMDMKSFHKVSGIKPAAASGLTGMLKVMILGGSYIAAVYMMPKGFSEIGTVLLLASLLYQVSGAVTGIMSNLTRFISASESIQDFLTYTSIKDERMTGNAIDKNHLKNQKDYGIKPNASIGCEIEFDNVSFRYQGSEKVKRESVATNDFESAESGQEYQAVPKYALKNISVKITNGCHLALVGRNGSGKSTFIKLLCGLYQPSEGRILLNGVDISTFDIEEYQKLFGVVFQDFTIFSLSLGQNIAAADDYDREKAEECIQKAGLMDFYNELPDKLDTILDKDFEDGMSISKGEGQKIAMARSLYKDSKMMILDEPTAALDPIAEYEIYKSMSKLTENKTSIFISHRLSSCRICDEIIVLDEGKLVQHGRHEELAADADSIYSQMWNAQAQYYT